ncbi:unnamed protein product [Cyclocybe aegerita]|uniref:Uncharacterized protein n=1 Tax=Cyclocybe aegerita TaxID=1973307 RepID=A0A8S0XJ01_CYCAE|nr:unnamed protein product [Cyclocybe aegerita]
MAIKIGVALYFFPPKNNLPGYFHWAIVATTASSWNIQPVMVYEIKRGMSGRFVQSFTFEQLDGSGAFTGIVDLFTTTAYSTFNQISDRLVSIGAEDRGWRFLGGFGPEAGWDCTAWVLQALQRFRDDRAWNVPDEIFLRVYTSILNRGSEMLYSGVSAYIKTAPLIRIRGY